MADRSPSRESAGDAAGNAYAGERPAATGRPAPAAPARATASAWRVLGLLALAAGGAVLLYLLRPGALTDDTYAFLDWGRDLRHGYMPLLEHRTFHPVPIAVGAVLSLFGSAAPTIGLLLTLASLVLLAVAAWRLVGVLGFPQPGPVLAAALVISSPLLSLLAQVGYINLPFATLVLWALVLELEERPRGAWALLLTAGLVRPEGWAFLLAYGALRWWRAGRPRAPRRWLGLAALALGPMALWLVLEWRLFGTPGYSFSETRAPSVEATGSGSLRGLWRSLHFAVAIPVLIAAGVGALATARLAPRRLAAVTLGTLLVAIATLLVLATSKFNVPSRHFSPLVSLICVLAAAGAVTPARLLARGGRASRRALAAVGVCGVALVAGLAVSPTVHLLRRNFKTVDETHEQRVTLGRALTRALNFVDVRGAQRHTVAIVGAVVESEVVWSLHVPFNVVNTDVEPRTRMIIQPAAPAYRRLGRLGLRSARVRVVPPPSWRRVVATGEWDVWIPPGRRPIRLRAPAG